MLNYSGFLIARMILDWPETRTAQAKRPTPMFSWLYIFRISNWRG